MLYTIQRTAAVAFTLLQKRIPSKGSVRYFDKQNPLQIRLAYRGLCRRSANPWSSLKIPFLVPREGSHLQGEPGNNHYPMPRKKTRSRQADSYTRCPDPAAEQKELTHQEEHRLPTSSRQSCWPGSCQALSTEPSRAGLFAAAKRLSLPETAARYYGNARHRLRNREAAPALPGGRCAEGRPGRSLAAGRNAAAPQAK